MNHILTTFYLSDTIVISGYYILDDDQHRIVKNWYYNWVNSFQNYIISDTIILTDNNFSIEDVDCDDKCEYFIRKYGNTCNILEHIEELESVFDSNNNIKYDSVNAESDDSDLYTDTTNVSNLIEAHISGRHDEVQMLLSKTHFDENDDIINKIKIKIKK